MPLEEWTRKEADGTLPSGDYVVTAIVAERTRPGGGRARQFLVKWQVSRSPIFCACFHAHTSGRGHRIHHRRRSSLRRTGRQILWDAQGFELNPHQWLPLKQLQHCTALHAWQQSRKAEAEPKQTLLAASQTCRHASTGEPPHRNQKRKSAMQKSRMCKARKI